MVTRTDSERLIKYGFWTGEGKKLFKGKSRKEITEALKDYDDEQLKGYASHEELEQTQFQYVKTEFPKPFQTLRIWWENFNLSIEEAYFWVLLYVRVRCGYPNVIKTYDVFSAAENSAFFGVSQQRIGLQQDKVSAFLATIGKMVKELFQLVRELRIIDERMDYYRDSYHPNRKRAQAAEITLKGIFIDMVEQGAKNPASVYGMARELQFATLPDLFFSVTPRTPADVDKAVDALEFNEMVKRVLKRKLYAFMKWKEKTEHELKSRRTFTLKYLKQHWEIIRMYMNWVRPYLRHINRLTMDEERMKTPDLVSAFEGSMIEVELLCYQLPYLDSPKFGPENLVGKRNRHYYCVQLCHFLFRTRPAMSYQQEGYNRGPVHIGRINLTLRGYVWDKKGIDNYIAMKDEEDLELMKSISGAVKAAMEALGEELIGYLREAEGKGAKKAVVETPPEKPPGVFAPFTAPFKGGVGKLLKWYTSSHPSGEGPMSHDNEHFVADMKARWTVWETYKNFKKEHKMLHW